MKNYHFHVSSHNPSEKTKGDLKQYFNIDTPQGPTRPDEIVNEGTELYEEESKLFSLKLPRVIWISTQYPESLESRSKSTEFKGGGTSESKAKAFDFWDCSHLEEAIKSSRKLVDSPEYDENGNEIRCDIETWEGSMKFLRQFIRHGQMLKRKIPSPKIYHGPNSGIDLLWEYDNFRMLIAISPNCESATFYAENGLEQYSEGSIPKMGEVDFKLLPIPPAKLTVP